MPPIKKKKLTRRWTEGTFECPKCGSVHHYDSVTGCHNNRCDYKGDLTPRETKEERRAKNKRIKEARDVRQLRRRESRQSD